VLEYKQHKKESYCTKPFDTLWVFHIILIIIFRVFDCLENYFNYMLALMDLGRDITGVRRARLKAIAMWCCKLSVYCGFLALTLVGIFWFIKEGRCLTSSDNNAEFKMTF